MTTWEKNTGGFKYHLLRVDKHEAEQAARKYSGKQQRQRELL